MSRIINGTVNVSEGLKRAVEAAIVKFDFRPNAAARGLALGRTSTIGVVAQAIDSPFYGEGLRGIEAGLRQRGYAPLIMSGNWRIEDEERCVQELIARGVDGVIVFAGRLSDAKLRGYAKSLPIVITGRRLRAAHLYSLQIEDAGGAQLPYGIWSASGTGRSPSSPDPKIIRTPSSACAATRRPSPRPASTSIPSWSRSAIGTRKAAFGPRWNCSAPSCPSPRFSA